MMNIQVKVNEQHFNSFDNTAIFYRAWHPQSKVQKKALILFHGGHEHSGRFNDLVHKLSLQDVSVFAWDARGHGKTVGQRGYATHYMDLVRDADAFIHHITAQYAIPRSKMVILGHSVGSVTVATWLHDYAPPVKAVVLGSPAFDIKLYIPFAYAGLRLWQKLKPDAFISSYVKPAILTHDKKEAEERANDALISPDIAVRVLTSLHDTAKRVIADAHTIKAPVLILSAGRDWVVKRKPQHIFMNNLSSENKAFCLYPDFFHEIYHEKKRHLPIAKAKTFIENCFFHEAEKDTTWLEGENQQIFNHLQQKLPIYHWKKYYYGLTAFALKHVGSRLSMGMKIGWQYGFDSGSMLNYVYQNKANGWSPLGKLIDRTYLNSAGWAGIRQRGENLQQALIESVEYQKKQHQSIQIMDIAAGPGRYIIDTLEDLKDKNITAICRDKDQAGLSEGRALVKEKGLDKVIQYLSGDAFDPDSIKATPNQPQIIVVSGLYELFADNRLILKSLQGIYDCLPENGTLIYTNQPWHPQLELIARTLLNRDQKPWVMRPRSQAEMNNLVESIGFKQQKMWIDNAGIFTVSIAQK